MAPAAKFTVVYQTSRGEIGQKQFCRDTPIRDVKQWCSSQYGTIQSLTGSWLVVDIYHQVIREYQRHSV